MRSTFLPWFGPTHSPVGSQPNWAGADRWASGPGKDEARASGTRLGGAALSMDSHVRVIAIQD
jgi:hypothetical protein